MTDLENRIFALNETDARAALMLLVPDHGPDISAVLDRIAESHERTGQ